MTCVRLYQTDCGNPMAEKYKYRDADHFHEVRTKYNRAKMKQEAQEEIEDASEQKEDGCFEEGVWGQER